MQYMCNTRKDGRLPNCYVLIDLSMSTRLDAGQLPTEKKNWVQSNTRGGIRETTEGRADHSHSLRRCFSDSDL